MPIPPSKSKDDPLYDDRNLKLLKLFSEGRRNIDIRDCILIKETMTASHDTDHRPSPQEIFDNLKMDLSQCQNKKEKIILVDDLITTGAHFKACKKLLHFQFPDSSI